MMARDYIGDPSREWNKLSSRFTVPGEAGSDAVQRASGFFHQDGIESLRQASNE